MASKQHIPYVLFVDDEIGNLDGFKAAFRKDFHILLAESGQEALEILEKNPVDVLVADHRMPNMTGAELLAIAVEKYPDIIRFMVTAYSDIEAVVQAINNGQISGYFTKPVNPQEFLKKTQKALEGYYLRQENQQLVKQLEKINKSLQKQTEQLTQEVKERKAAEDRYHQSYEEFKNLLEAAPDAMIISDVTGVIRQVNSAAEILLKTGRKNILGKKFHEFLDRKSVNYSNFHLTMPPQFADLVKNHMAEGDVVLENGEYMHVQVTLSPHKSGEEMLYIAAIRDITEQKIVQDKVKESEHKYRNLLDSFPQRVFFKDLQGHFVTVNACMAKDFNMTSQQMIGKTDFDIHPQKYAKNSTEIDKRVITEKITITEDEEQKVNGRVRHFRTVKSPVYDDNEQIIGLFGISTDITSTIDMEKTLEWERYLFSTFMNNITDTIYFKDIKSRFIRANNAAVKKFGCQEESELIGKTDFDFFTDAHAHKAYQDEVQIISTGTPITGEECETWLRGEETWVSTVKLPLKNPEGEIIGTFGISRDITTQKADEFRLQMFNQELALLNEINLLAIQKKGIRAVCQAVINFMETVFEAKNIIFYRYNKKNGQLVREVTSIHNHLFQKIESLFNNDAGGMHPRLAPELGYYKAVHNRKSFVLTNPDEIENLLLDWTEKGKGKVVVKQLIKYMQIKNSGAIPLATENGTLGLIIFSTDLYPNTEMLERMDRIGSQIALVIEKIIGEYELQESQEKINLALDSSFIGFWTWNVVNDEMWWDERTRAILGIAPQTPASMDILKEIAHPDDLMLGLEKLQRVFNGETVKDFYIRIIHPDKSVHHILFRGKGIRNRRDQIVQFNLLCIDVTDRMQAEEDLQKSTDRLTALTSALPDLIFMMNEDGIFVDVLASRQDLLYTSISNMKNNSIYNTMPSKESADKVYHYIQKTLQTRKIQTFEFMRTVPIGDRWFEGRMAPMQYEIDGKRTVVYIARDITEQKEATEKLAQFNAELEERVKVRTEALESASAQIRKNEERLKLAFTGSAISWWDWDCISDIVLMHENKYTNLGYSAKNSSNSFAWWRKLIHPKDVEAFETHLQQVLNGEVDALDIEYRIMKKDGEYTWVYDRGIVVNRNDAGAAVRVVGVTQDISARKKVEKERERQNQFLNTLLNTLPTPIFAKDKNMRYTVCNKAFLEMFNIHEDEFIGKTIHDFVSPELAKEYDEMDLELMQQLGSKSEERELDVANNDKRNLIFHVATLVDDANKANGIITVLSDISNIKRAEKAMAESEARYRLLFDASPDGILIADAATLQIKYANKAACELFGYSVNELLTLNIQDVHPQEEVEQRQEDFDQKVKSNQVAEGSVTILTKAGKIIPTDIRSSIIEFDGRPHVMGIFRDITERLQTEQALKESERRFRELTDLLPQSVFELNRDGYFVYVNQYSLETTGYTTDEIEKGMHYSQMIIQSETPTSGAFFEAILEGQKIEPHEYMIRRKDGSEFPCMIYTTPIIRDGEISGIRGITIDITERKRIEKALKDRAEELEVFNKSMLGREKRIIELKEEVNKLAMQLNHELPYPPIWN